MTITIQLVRTMNQPDRIHEFSAETHGEDYRTAAIAFAFARAESKNVSLVRVVDGTGVTTITHKAG